MRLELPPAPTPSGAYRPVMVVGDLAYLSGFGPRDAAGNPIVGTVGAEFDLAESQAIARGIALTMLSALQDELGDLDRIRQMARVTGMIACTPGFTQHPAVLDGASKTFIEILGPNRGAHARMAYGVASLPNGSPVAVDAVVWVRG
jgi:enamine deaminase RidA (YjgF/YER057c/UK114 family)